MPLLDAHFCLRPTCILLTEDEDCVLLIALAFHMWIFNEGFMNNSEKQAVVFESKWTCKELRIRQTLTADILSTPALTEHLVWPFICVHMYVMPCVNPHRPIQIIVGCVLKLSITVNRHIFSQLLSTVNSFFQNQSVGSSSFYLTPQ